MTIKLKYYSALLLTASISLPSVATVDANTATAVIEEKDTDGDGVMDSMDACPGTPMNTIVDERGCPTPLDIIEEPTIDSYAHYFENSSEFRSIGYDRLNHISEALQRHEEGVMIIEGYIGKHENRAGNENLAKDRAEAIKSYVVSNYNIDPKRIRTYGCGLTAPLATNETLEGREMNQWSYAMVRSGFSKSSYKCRMTSSL